VPGFGILFMMNMVTTNSVPSRTSVTRDDVARVAGVSVATVSLGLRGDLRVKAQTRKRVLMVAQQMNYRPLASARALAVGKTHTVGVIFNQPFGSGEECIRLFSKPLEVINEFLARHDYHTSLAFRLEIETEDGRQMLPRMLRESGIEGFIILQAPGPQLAQAIEDQQVPFVLFDTTTPADQFNVRINETRSAEMMVEHLVQLGHRRIASIFVTTSSQYSSLYHRTREFPQGYVRGMAQAGLSSIIGWDEARSVIEHLEILWNREKPPTALILYDEDDAYKAIIWLMKRGLSVPTDVSVAGLVDHDLSSHTWLPEVLPTVTCRDNLHEEMGLIAVKTLLKLIEEPEEKVEPVLLEPRLIVRQSTGVVWEK
jgi:LacI family transcriptional regulator